MHLFWCGSSLNRCFPWSGGYSTLTYSDYYSQEIIEWKLKNSFLEKSNFGKKVLVDTFRILAYLKLCLFWYGQAYSALLTVFQMERGVWRKGTTAPPTSLFTVTSTDKGISLQTSWLLVLTIFLCNHFSSPYLISVPNYLTWTKSTPQNNNFSGQILIKLRLW